MSITALSLGESVLLLRELPQTAALFGDTAGQTLLQRLLLAVQGHPKLLEMAAALAADRAALQFRLNQLDEAGQNAALQRFFEQGVSTQQESDFIHQLQEWTTNACNALPPLARRLLELLACLEETDREWFVVSAVWPLLAGKTAIPGDLRQTAEHAHEELAPARASLQAAALLEIRPTHSKAPADESAQQRLLLHPALAETVRSLADPAFREAVDLALGTLWTGIFSAAKEKEQQGMGKLVVHAARHAIPYWLRRRRWDEAGMLLEQLLHRDESPDTLAYALPLLRTIAEASTGTERELEAKGSLARCLSMAGRSVEAEMLLREGINKAVDIGRYRIASSLASDLLEVFSGSGRLEEALALCAEMANYSRSADLGPWTQLAQVGQRLQVLNALGRWKEVLQRIKVLLPQLRQLPENSETEEAVHPWNVRETLLGTARTAALYQRQWQAALDFNEETLHFKRARGVDALEQAITRLNDYGPFLRLKRYVECRQLLQECQETFSNAKDYESLGKVYGALAGLENELGHLPQAVEFAQAALRYAYQLPKPENCSISHNNLAGHLLRRGTWATASEHFLAAAMIALQTGSGHLQTSVENLAKLDLPDIPPGFDEIVASVERLDGVRFREMFARLPTRYPNGDATLAALWEMLGQARAGRSAGPDMARVLEEFQPWLTDIAAAALGNETPRAAIEEMLSQFEAKGWRIGAAARALWGGERDETRLMEGLDQADTQLVKHMLELVAQREEPSSRGTLVAGERGMGFCTLPGDPGTVDGDKFVCPESGCCVSWVRRQVGQRVPICEKHGKRLVPAA